MAFALLIIGIVLITASVRNMQAALIALLGGDFSGQGNFLYWVVAIIAIGAVGYVPKMKGVSDGLLVLILLALVLKAGNPGAANGGVFNQLMTALGATKNPSSTNITGNSLVNNVGQQIGSVLNTVI